MVIIDYLDEYEYFRVGESGRELTRRCNEFEKKVKNVREQS